MYDIVQRRLATEIIQNMPQSEVLDFIFNHATESRLMQFYDELGSEYPDFAIKRFHDMTLKRELSDDYKSGILFWIKHAVELMAEDDAYVCRVKIFAREFSGWVPITKAIELDTENKAMVVGTYRFPMEFIECIEYRYYIWEKLKKTVSLKVPYSISDYWYKPELIAHLNEFYDKQFSKNL